jgi:hypothetical protein
VQVRSASGSHGAGQALVEFAIVVPLLALLLTGIYQFAIIFERQIGITNAVREDARRAAALVTTNTPSGSDPDGNADENVDWALKELICIPTSDSTDPCYDHSHLLYDNVQDYAADPSTLIDAQVCYKPSTSNDPTGNGYATVEATVTYGHPLFMPIISGILDGIDGTADNHFAVTTNVEFRVENQPNDNGITPQLTIETCAT